MPHDALSSCSATTRNISLGLKLLPKPQMEPEVEHSFASDGILANYNIGNKAKREAIQVFDKELGGKGEERTEQNTSPQNHPQSEGVKQSYTL